MTDDAQFNQRLNDALKRNDMDMGRDVPVTGDGRDAAEGQMAEAAGMAFGMRIATEFFAGTLVGLGIGLGLDRLFDTKPWLLLAFTLLGFCAGMLNVYRTVNRLSDTIGVNRHNVLTKDAQGLK